MKKPTEKQIAAEIKALEKCKSYAPNRSIFGDDNHHTINLQIEYLKGEIDTTAAEWDDFSDDEQSAILEAQNWEEGEESKSPSSGWDNFKKSTKLNETRPDNRRLR